MTLIQWDESMSVGHDEIDDQHKKLIGLINRAYKAMQKHDEHMMVSLINEMRDYATMHFTTEETLIENYGFPKMTEHKWQHAKFNKTVEDFQKKQFDTMNLSQIFVFLSRWLTTHIMEEDMQYVPYLPKKES
ncbi:bacteriohemerythrin [uncultured Pseudodesulfovibrio sp.]|uniref:bacteriohemerythrin n=1 Tax=uncultured Pseudodesulfovibrio sp. TaxID=2035858 RepID=UPI0029C712AD|nr:bacteriohemerythrin [uncultured Pseudodesulfovibrio sp.]